MKNDSENENVECDFTEKENFNIMNIYYELLKDIDSVVCEKLNSFDNSIGLDKLKVEEKLKVIILINLKIELYRQLLK